MAKKLNPFLKNTFIVLSEYNETITKMRVNSFKIIATLLSGNSVKIENHQPYIHTEHGSIAVDEVSKKWITGLDENGNRFELDMSDLSTDDIIAIVEIITNIEKNKK